MRKKIKLTITFEEEISAEYCDTIAKVAIPKDYGTTLSVKAPNIDKAVAKKLKSLGFNIINE